MARNLSSLGSLYERLDRLADAEGVFRRALTTLETLLGPEHPDLTPTLGNLGEICVLQLRHADAEVLYKRLVAISERDAKPDLGYGLHWLAVTRCEQGRYAEALPDFARALELYESLHGSDHPDLMLPLLDYATALMKEEGDGHDVADELVNRSLSIAKEHLGASDLEKLADIYDHRGRPDEAELLRRRAQTLGRTH